MQTSNIKIFPRKLTEHEKSILKTIIKNAPAPKEKTLQEVDRQKLINIIPTLKVVGECECGNCCSIELNHKINSKERYTLEAYTAEAMIILFIDDNELSYLELAPYEDNKVFTTFPAVKDLEF